MASCYFPNGDPALDDTPCNSTADQSACCSTLATCIANGVCYKDGTLSRGSCTDKSWESDACAPVCKDYGTEGGANIFSCNLSTIGGNTWACGSRDYCNDGAFTFTMANLKPALRQSEISSSYVALFGAESTTTPTGDASASAIVCPSCAGTFSSGEMAGLGVGIAVPLSIALVALVWLLVAERKRGRTAARGQNEPEIQNYHTVPELGGQGVVGRPVEQAELDGPRETMQELPVRSGTRRSATG